MVVLIMNSSSYYSLKIEKLKTARSKLKGLSSYIEDSTSAAEKCEKFTEELTINGQTIDQGKLKTIKDTISDVDSNITSLISECDERISEYQELYQKALAAEREAREKKEESTN